MTREQGSSSSEVNAYFERAVAGYSTRSETGLWAWQRRRESEAVMSFMPPLTGLDVLDLGSGDGFYTRLALELGAQSVTAVDRSEGMVAALPRDRVTGVCANVQDLDLQRTFPVLISAGLMEFVDEPERVFERARHHADAGTPLICLVPPDNLFGRLYRAFHRRHGFTINLFTERQIKHMADRTGWAIKGTKFVAPYSLVVRLDSLV